MKLLPNVGERIVVYGMTHAQVVVESVSWDKEKHDWKVCLDWGNLENPESGPTTKIPSGFVGRTAIRTCRFDRTNHGSCL